LQKTNKELSRVVTDNYCTTAAFFEILTKEGINFYAYKEKQIQPGAKLLTAHLIKSFRSLEISKNEPLHKK